MFAFIRGVLSESSPSYLVVEANGLGYKLLAPPSYLSKLPPFGEVMTFYTSTVMRENSYNLYGFLSPQERDLFELLIEISGIGPKTALALLAVLTPLEFSEAIRHSDTTKICKVPGIGKKTAERLVIDIRDKLPAIIRWEDEMVGAQPGKRQTVLDAINALMNLGYTHTVAQQAVKKTLMDCEEETLELPLLITSALRNAR